MARTNRTPDNEPSTEQLEDYRLGKDEYLRDPRSGPRRLYDYFGDPYVLGWTLVIIGGFLLGASWIGMIGLVEIGFLTILLCFGMVAPKAWYDYLPLFLPASDDRRDFHNREPGLEETYDDAGGIVCIGNVIETMEQMWLRLEDLTEHLLVFGSTGSGKSEFQFSYLLNFLMAGGGGIFINPKGDIDAFYKIERLAEMVGKEDDIRVLNFESSAHGDEWEKLSHFHNFFSYGTGDQIAELLIGIIPEAEGNNKIFQDYAQSLVRGLAYGLVDLRDRADEKISVRDMKKYMDQNKYIELAQDPRVSEEHQEQMMYFLNKMGYDPDEDPNDQSQKFTEQFNYGATYFQRTLSDLTDVYGHIFNCEHSEVDMKDIITNRRILVVQLPSLEKADETTENLGELILVSIRNAVATGLGEGIEGSKEETFYSRPVNAELPLPVIVDEYAAIPTTAFTEVLTQARSIFISALIGSQDLAGIERASEKASQQIVANTNTKIFMRLKDTEKTGDLLKSISGTVTVAKVQRLDEDDQRLTGGQKEGPPTVQFEEEERVDLQDVQGFDKGEFFCIHDGNTHHGYSMYQHVSFEPEHVYELPKFVGVPHPDADDLSRRYGAINRISSLLETLGENDQTLNDFLHSDQVPYPFLDVLADEFKRHDFDNNERGPERAITAFKKTVESLDQSQVKNHSVRRSRRNQRKQDSERKGKGKQRISRAKDKRDESEDSAGDQPINRRSIQKPDGSKNKGGSKGTANGSGASPPRNASSGSNGSSGGPTASTGQAHSPASNGSAQTGSSPPTTQDSVDAPDGSGNSFEDKLMGEVQKANSDSSDADSPPESNGQNGTPPENGSSDSPNTSPGSDEPEESPGLDEVAQEVGSDEENVREEVETISRSIEQDYPDGPTPEEPDEEELDDQKEDWRSFLNEDSDESENNS